MKRNGFDREMCGDYFQYVIPKGLGDFEFSIRHGTFPGWNGFH